MFGNDHPDPSGPPRPLEGEEARSILKPLCITMAVATGGMVIFASLSTPHRIQGATRSAHIEWEARQMEIHQTIADNKPIAESNNHSLQAGSPP